MRKQFAGTIQISSVYAGSFGGAIFTGKALGGRYPIKFRAGYKVLIRTPESGEFWFVSGEIVSTKNYGNNVNVSECRIVPLPAENYLSSLLIKHPSFRGIGLGKSKVNKLIKHIGSYELMRLMDTENYLAIADIIAEPIARALCTKWNPLHQEMKLANFLMEHNIDQSLSKKIIKVCKYNTLERIKKNPYGLLAFGSITRDFWKTIDRVSLQLGVLKDSRERKVGAVEYILYQHLLGGDTAMPEQELTLAINKLLGEKYSKNAIEEACKIKAVCFFMRAEVKYFQTAGAGQIEAQLEKQIIRLSNQKLQSGIKVTEFRKVIDHYSEHNFREQGYHLTGEQKLALKVSLTRRISVITGYGGTGKTTVLRAAVDLAEQQSRSVFILALAGKAKERAREATSRDDIIFTIHGFIKQLMKAKRELRLETPMIIIDEASMVDISLANKLLKHLENTNYSLVLVGDTGQLSPVGFGIFFHACVGQIPTSHLTQVHRQARDSPIHNLAMLIRNGEVAAIPEWKGESSGVFFVNCASNKTDLIKKLIKVTKTRMGQIITPHASNAMIDNTNAINESMQYVHNKGFEGLGIKLGNRTIKENDPIIVTSNNYELELFNGMTGYIVSIELGESTENIVTEFNGRIYTLSKDQCFELGIELAYAITIHKSQGSEYDTAIICCAKGSKMLERSMIYTALTRSKKLAIFVGSYEILEGAVKKLPRAETIVHGFSII